MANFDWHAARSDLHGLTLLDRAPESLGIDLASVGAYRLRRVRQMMQRYNIDALILSDPVNIRYATGTRNMQVFSMRNAPSRYLLVTQDRNVLWEFKGCCHLAEGFQTVDEVREARTASFVAAGDKIEEREREWAGEMVGVVRGLVSQNGGCGEEGKVVLGVERLNAGVAIALKELGMVVVDAQRPVEMARSVKSDEELKCVVASLRATEVAVGKLRDAVQPGITENELWAVLHKSVIEQNGDYCETRLLSAGPRTNPWFQEASSFVIGEDMLVALDTDVVGVFG